MVKPNQTERRRHPRVRIEAPMDLGSTDQGLACQLRDISRVGAAVVLDRPLGELELLGLKARIAYDDLPTVELEGQAVVVRCDQTADDRYEVGLFFHQLTDASRAQLEAFIAAVSSSPAGC